MNQKCVVREKMPIKEMRKTYIREEPYWETQHREGAHVPDPAGVWVGTDKLNMYGKDLNTQML